MSAEPERVFSRARRTISWERMLLGSPTVKKGECMKSWIRSGITRGIPVELAEQFLEEDGLVEERDSSTTEKISDV